MPLSPPRHDYSHMRSFRAASSDLPSPVHYARSSASEFFVPRSDKIQGLKSLYLRPSVVCPVTGIPKTGRYGREREQEAEASIFTLDGRDLARTAASRVWLIADLPLLLSDSGCEASWACSTEGTGA